MLKKYLIIGVICLLMITTSAVALGNDTVSPPVNKSGFYTAIVIGRITNFDFDAVSYFFDAINVRILTCFPFKYYHLNSGEELSIARSYLGKVTEEFIIAFCQVNIAI